MTHEPELWCTSARRCQATHAYGTEDIDDTVQPRSKVEKGTSGEAGRKTEKNKNVKDGLRIGIRDHHQEINDDCPEDQQGEGLGERAKPNMELLQQQW